MDAEKLTMILGYVLLALGCLNVLMTAAKTILENLAVALKKEGLSKAAVTLGKICEILAKVLSFISANTAPKK